MPESCAARRAADRHCVFGLTPSSCMPSNMATASSGDPDLAADDMAVEKVNWSAARPDGGGPAPGCAAAIR